VIKKDKIAKAGDRAATQDILLDLKYALK